METLLHQRHELRMHRRSPIRGNVFPFAQNEQRVTHFGSTLIDNTSFIFQAFRIQCLGGISNDHHENHIEFRKQEACNVHSSIECQLISSLPQRQSKGDLWSSRSFGGPRVRTHSSLSSKLVVIDYFIVEYRQLTYRLSTTPSPLPSSSFYSPTTACYDDETDRNGNHRTHLSSHLSVFGNAIAPERKPPVPTMSERDVTRRHDACFTRTRSIFL